MQEERMTCANDEARRDETQGGLNRRAFMLRLLAVGAVYAAPALVALNEAEAGSRPSRRSRHSRHTRHTRHSRYSRHSRGTRGSRHWHQPPPGGFREQGRPRQGGPQGGWRPN